MTKQKRDILVLVRYFIKKDCPERGLHAGDVVLYIQNDKGARYYTTLRRNKQHSCTCPATVRCYHINQMVEKENARYAAEKAYKMSTALHEKLAPIVTPKVEEVTATVVVIEVPKVAKVRKSGNKLVKNIDYQSARTLAFFSNLPSRKELATVG